MDRSYRHTVSLKALFPEAQPIGYDRFKALCPVHLERNPSCIVNYHADHGWRWHCFACGADGDALDVLTLRGMAFREALDLLCARRSEEDWQPSRRAVPAESAGSGAYLLICDACGFETLEVRERRYGRGRSEWTSIADLEAATAPGWEVSAGLQFAVGPKCLDRAC